MSKLIIMQGISGSGKSRVARRLARRLHATVVSADAFTCLYTADGFHPELLGEAHRSCIHQTARTILKGRHVIVDNTNLTVEEMLPYVLFGRALRLKVEVVRVECPQSVAFARQKHGVPEKTHKRQAARLASFKVPTDWEVTVKMVKGSA